VLLLITNCQFVHQLVAYRCHGNHTGDYAYVLLWWKQI
jgi:hypothetical protein